SLSYTSGVLMSATIGSQLAQQYTYTSGYLTEIDDGTPTTPIVIAKFAYSGTTNGQLDRVDTPRGVVGFEYNSSRTACSTGTVLFFNKGSTTSCSQDSDCGTGSLCGGKTGTGSTGTCFLAARCLTLTTTPSPLKESLIDTVT